MTCGHQNHIELEHIQPLSCDASVRRCILWSGSKCWIDMCLIITSLILSKSCCWVSVQRKATSFLSNAQMLAVMWATSGIKIVSWLISPRNEHVPGMSVGAGKSQIAHIFSSSGDIPSLEVMYPANLIVSPISIFCLDIVIPCSQHLSMIFRSAWIKMSSTSFATPSRSATAAFEHMFHSSVLDDRPIGALVYWYFPVGSSIVVRCDEFSSMGIWK